MTRHRFWIGSLACLFCTPVGAEPVSSETEAMNQFRQALEVRDGAPEILPRGEDLASPFVRAHMAEQSLYTSSYLYQYNARYDGGTPLLRKLPDALDPQGRPLWFDGVSGRAELMRLVQELYVHEQVQDLDRLLKDWSEPSEKLADGRWKLAIFDNALTDSIGAEGMWELHKKRIESWKLKAPQSPAVALIESIFWRNYAWDARGQGWAKGVSDDRWTIFYDRLNKSAKALHDTRAYASANPLWGRLLIQVGSELDQPKLAIQAVFDEEVAKNGNFQPIYVTMVRYQLPKWGGSWEAVDALIAKSVKNSSSAEATSMYARLYWQIAREEDLQNERLFSETKATWGRMKSSFEDMIRLYPHSAHNLNTFAAAACIANDGATFSDLRRKIGKVVTPDAWPSDFSMDYCEHKFTAKAL